MLGFGVGKGIKMVFACSLLVAGKAGYFALNFY